MHTEHVLITVSGPDNPGITSHLMNIIKRTNEEIVDMGQAVTHGLLSLSFLLKMNKNDHPEYPVLKDLLFAAKKLGLELEFKIVEGKLKKSDGPKKEKFILNCVSTHNISAHFIYDISHCLAKNKINILRIDNVDPLHFQSLEITTLLPNACDLKELKSALLTISNKYSVDIAFLKDNVFRRNKRLIVFDMDSTLIQTEVIDEMAEEFGVGDEVKAITEAAMNGEIDFNESLIQRVGKLKGLEAIKLQKILDNLPFTLGALDFIKTVQKVGYKVAIISGGFSFFANALKEQLHLNYAFANELEIVDGLLTGKVLGTIVNAEQKALLVNLIAQQENISLEQVVAIGDGANDLPMLAVAGLGIAFHAKEVVKKSAGQHMSHGPMTSILYFLGIPGVNGAN